MQQLLDSIKFIFVCMSIHVYIYMFVRFVFFGGNLICVREILMTRQYTHKFV